MWFELFFMFYFIVAYILDVRPSTEKRNCDCKGEVGELSPLQNSLYSFVYAWGVSGLVLRTFIVFL